MNRNGFHNQRFVGNGHNHLNNYQYQNGNNRNSANSRRRTVSSGETENEHPIYRDCNSFSYNNNAKYLNNVKTLSTVKDKDILKIRSVDKANKTLNDFRKDGKFCDFELRVKEQVFPVHKLILSSASPYFEAMFYNKANFVENAENFTELHDVDQLTCEMLLNYIYTGEININSHNVQDIARVCNMFQLMELSEYCAKFLENNLSVNNCIGILCFADFYNFQNLCYEAKRFVERRFAEVCKEEEFLDLPVTLLRSFLRSENLSIDSEYQVLSSTLNWILKDEASRLKYLDEYINLIRMPLITPDQIKKFTDNCSHVEILKALSPYLQSQRLTPEDMAESKNVGYNFIRFQPRMCCRRRIYVLGGLSIRYNDRPSPHTLHTMVKFNLHTGSWDQESSFIYPRSSHCVVKMNSKIYLIGGECDSLILDTVEIYDPEGEGEEHWIRGANLKFPRSSFGACEFEGRIYAFGGKGSCSGNSIEQFDPELNMWNLYDKMPMHLYGMQVVAHEGLIYIIGGRSQCQTVGTLLSYNPVTHQFRQLAPMNMARSDFGCTVLHGNIYVIGGLDLSGEPLTTVEQYNITENKWSFLAPLKMRRSSLCAISINNLIYIFGGKQMNNPRSLKNVDVYDPDCDQWYTSKPMPQNRSEAAVVII